MEKTSSKLRDFFKNVLLLGGSFAFILVLSEILVRIFWAAPEFQYPQALHDKHETLGWVMKPNQSSFTYGVPVHTNSLGLRSEEITVAKPDQTRRILILGDSVTFGVLVEDDETYSAVLQKRLNAEATGNSWQVINSGVQRYYTYQELDFLKLKGLDLEPDVVVLGYYINDLGTRPKVWTRDYEKDREQLATKLWQRVPWIMHVVKNSALANFTRDRVRRLISSRRANQYSQSKLLNGIRDKKIERGIASAREYVAEIDSLSKVHNFKFLIAAFPGVNQVIAPMPDAIYPDFIKEIAAEQDVPFVDLLPVFKKHFDGDIRTLYFRYNGHPNAFGHRLAAEAIHKALQQQAFLDDAPAISANTP